MNSKDQQGQIVISMPIVALYPAFMEKFPKIYAMGVAFGILEFTYNRRHPTLNLQDGRVIHGWFAIEQHLNPLEELLGGSPSESTLCSFT